jgi:hypothetical protein
LLPRPSLVFGEALGKQPIRRAVRRFVAATKAAATSSARRWARCPPPSAASECGACRLVAGSSSRGEMALGTQTEAVEIIQPRSSIMLASIGGQERWAERQRPWRRPVRAKIVTCRRTAPQYRGLRGERFAIAVSIHTSLREAARLRDKSRPPPLLAMTIPIMPSYTRAWPKSGSLPAAARRNWS